jgi:parvulin-like peptidyl-prolyl isomerase
MIIALRKSIKSRTFRIILWVILLAACGAFSVFEFLRTSFFGGSSGNSPWIMKISGHSITMPEYMRAVADQEMRIRFIRSQYGQYADLYFQMMGMKLDPQALAVDALIRKTLLNTVADQLPLHVDSGLAQSQLNNPVLISQELSDIVPLSAWDPALGGINPLLLNAYLQQMHISSSEFDAQLVQGIKRNDVKNLVEHSIYIPEFELKEKFAQNYLGHKFTIATISLQDMLEQVKKETVSDEKLKAYFDLKNSKEKRYYVPEKRSAKIVTFDPASYGITITDAEVEAYYTNNKAQYVDQPAQVQVRRIVLKVSSADKEQEVLKKAEALQQELVKAPDTFAARAKELSEDSKSASQGGLMPSFSKGQHSEAFAKTAFLLKEGGISSVIKTDEGYEILQQVSKKAPTFKPLNQVSKDIKDALRNKKFASSFANDVRPLVGQSKGAELVSKFVQEKNGKESAVKEAVATNELASKTIFRAKEGETSFYQDGNQGVLVTVTAIKESYLPSLEEIKNKVKEDYYKDEAHTRLADRLHDIQTGKIGFDTLKDTQKTGWIVNSPDDKDNQKEKEALTKKGINLGAMFQIENKGGINTYQAQDKGFIIRLDDIASFDQALFDQKKGALLGELEQDKKGLTMAGFVASLYRNAKINKNESLIRIES